jgi:hypothetical protein
LLLPAIATYATPLRYQIQAESSPCRRPIKTFPWEIPALTRFHHKRDVRAITDLLPNRCEDASTVHHRELRQSPETNAFPAANFSPLFDNIWPRSAPSQVHAKQQNSTLSPIFLIFAYNYLTIINLTHLGRGGTPPKFLNSYPPVGAHRRAWR